MDIPKIEPARSQKSDKQTFQTSGSLLKKIDLKLQESAVQNKRLKNIFKLVRIKFKTGLPRPKKRHIKILGIICGVLVVVIAIFSFLFYRVYKSAIDLRNSVGDVSQALSQDDFAQLKTEFSKTRVQFDEFKSAYKGISWLKFMPYFGAYLKDGEHLVNATELGLETADLVIVTMEPFADIIGFKKDGQPEGVETAKDRFDFVVKAIPALLPKVDEISEKVVNIQAEVGKIDPNRYPVRAFGREIRPLVMKGIETVNLLARLVVEGKPLLQASPYLLGVEEERTYLLLFQNDKELRPTGGFITGYSIATVSKGHFEPVSSDDIYNLDGKYTPSVPASEPIVKYIGGPYLVNNKYRLRDMNWSPDFKESMELFLKEAEKAGIKNIDGVIAVDTQLLVNVLDVLGVVQVPGYGGYSTDIVELCSCPQVVYELESFADIEGPIVWSENEPGKIVFAPPNYDNRKKIIGPMMNSILTSALGQTSEKIPALFEAIIKSLLEKHVLIYMFDEKAQNGIESFGIAGRLKSYEGDYFYVNDANLGGRKSNLYVTQEVHQEVDIKKDGDIVKTVIITYKNPAPHDGWLNSVLPNYTRVYVPKGSVLLDATGFEEKEEPYEEFGKTVFAGFFELRPQGVSKITVTYKLPFKSSNNYTVYIEKQPGTDVPLHSIKVGKEEEEFFLNSDKELKFAL